MWKKLTIAALAFDMLAINVLAAPSRIDRGYNLAAFDVLDAPLLEGIPVAGIDQVEMVDEGVQSKLEGVAPSDTAALANPDNSNSGSFRIPITSHKSPGNRLSTMASRVRTLQKHMLDVPGKWLQAVEKLPVKEYGYGIEVS